MIGSIFERAISVLPSPLDHLLQQARRRDVPLSAAALAFYGIVALPPLAIFIVWAVSLALGDGQMQRVAKLVEVVAPDQVGAGQAVQRIVDLGTRLGVVALLAGLWPATSYGSALARAFHDLDPHGGDDAFPGLRGRVLLVAVLPILVIAGFVASLLGTTLLPDVLGGQALGLVVSLGTGFVGAAGVVAVLYRVFPPRAPELGPLVRSALITSVGIALGSLALTVYLRLGADFERHYATSGLAAIVLVAMWLYLFHLLLLAGYTLAMGSGGEATRREGRP